MNNLIKVMKLISEKYSNITQILALWGNSQPNSTGYSQAQAIEKINNFFI